MPAEETHETVQPGWIVEVTGHRVGDAPRFGEVLEVLGTDAHPHYRVRWEDAHESLFYPASDVVLRAPAASRAGAS